MSSPSPGKRFVGGLLMALGAMIALLCGLCTAVFGVAMLGNARSGLFPLVIPLVIGGVPTGVGVVVFLIGRAVYREGRAPQREPWREFE